MVKNFLALELNFVYIFFQQLALCMRLQASSREEQCTMCAGLNSTCHLISGIFTRRGLAYGYNKVATIPKGACSINITEMFATRNYIGQSNCFLSLPISIGWDHGSVTVFDTWFCYQLIAKPSNKTASLPSPRLYIYASQPIPATSHKLRHIKSLATWSFVQKHVNVNKKNY